MSNQATPQPVLIPAQPAVLVVGDRRIRVDEWPLARSAAEHRSVELMRTDDSFVIEPQRRGWVRRNLVVLVALVGGVVNIVLSIVVEGFPLWLGVLLVVALILFVAWSELRSLQWIRFDRKAGQLIFERRAGFRNKRRVERKYPLKSIRAVQLLYNGHHSVAEFHDGGGQSSYSCRDFHGYELNLVLDDTSKPRLNLLCLADWKWVRATGRQIGEFLGVPVIDKLHHGG